METLKEWIDNDAGFVRGFYACAGCGGMEFYFMTSNVDEDHVGIVCVNCGKVHAVLESTDWLKKPLEEPEKKVVKKAKKKAKK